VIDQSASVVARSEVMTRAREGRSLPLGWALDEAGEPTTEAEQAMRGTMVPSGGYKGFSAGLLVEVMAAALGGAILGRHASAFSGTVGGHRGRDSVLLRFHRCHFLTECLISVSMIGCLLSRSRR
jgi:(2R)-3-sulfolactate dehydrogenase (NADP+)